MKKYLNILLIFIIIAGGYLYYNNKYKCNISEIDVVKLNNFFNPSLVGNKEYWCELKMINIKLNPNGNKIIPEIGKLENLENLILNNKNLEGEIPNEIGNLKKLKVLGLSNNDLSGKIPETFKNLNNLYSLSLSNNKNLEGEIPKNLLKHLDVLLLDNTKINIDKDISKNIKYFSK